MPAKIIKNHFYRCFWETLKPRDWRNGLISSCVLSYIYNVYMCALWVNYRKTAFQQFKVAYNNSYRILNRLPMRCSASNMFANGNVNSCACVLRKSIYSLMTRIHASLNPIVNSIVRGDVYCTSALRIQWVSQLYNM